MPRRAGVVSISSFAFAFAFAFASSSTSLSRKTADLPPYEHFLFYQQTITIARDVNLRGIHIGHTIDCNAATRILRFPASGYFIFAPLAQITTTVNGWPDEARRFLASSLVAPLYGPSPFRSYRIIRLSIRYMYIYIHLYN